MYRRLRARIIDTMLILSTPCLYRRLRACTVDSAHVLLTPHIGGATEEAQSNIGEEVPTSLIRFVNTGSTVRSVNFPQMDLPPSKKSHRILNIHKNVPGVLREINRIVSDIGANINAQTLNTDADIGYLILDTDQAFSQDVKNAIEGLKTNIRTRILY